MKSSLALPVQDRSQAGEARRLAAIWGQDDGWSEELAGRVALVVTELGNNLAIHSSGGSLFLRRLTQDHSRGVEIISLDGGPGVGNFNECIRDGFSTAGTSGNGLGAVKRASQQFVTHSLPGAGTALLVELWDKPPGHESGRTWALGALNVAMKGEFVCGDSWSVIEPRPGIIRAMIADGIGHGELAAEAAIRAVEIFERHPTVELPAALERMHDALRSTRGAAIAIAEIDPGRQSLSYAGIGNISGCILSHGSSTNLVSMNGAVGVNARHTRVFEYPFPSGVLLAMASDGLKSQFNLSRYPGLLERHPGIIAAILYRDHARGRDDATSLVVRVHS